VTAGSGDGEQLPAAAWSGRPAEFSRYLADTGQDYVLVAAPDDQSAHVRFSGRFQGQPVVWDCEFVTLAAEQATGRAGGTQGLRNFIEIGEAGERGLPLRVGLALARVDRPAIEKMIIMIRNYKRLHPGRHEYGEPWV
jgi:hypothetical protein